MLRVMVGKVKQAQTPKHFRASRFRKRSGEFKQFLETSRLLSISHLPKSLMKTICSLQPAQLAQYYHRRAENISFKKRFQLLISDCCVLFVLVLFITAEHANYSEASRYSPKN